MAKKRRKASSGTRLTFEEKIIIQQMLADEKTVKEISTDLRRSITSIQAYIDDFKQLVTKINVNFTEDQDMPLNEFVSLEMYNETLKCMKLNGLANTTARLRLNSTIQLLTAIPTSAEELSKVAFSRITPQELMVTKSAGGREGITVMTEAASYRGDIKKPASKPKSHKCLYNAKTGEPI